jgi:alpha-N-arabinofuranosidase
MTFYEEIMDKADPQKRVGIMFDEWGAWHAVEPGTNPGFLYQQNSLRDAMVAGVTLNAFNNHCDRVKMANIAQCVNVLQAMILTDGPRMLLTPTYYAFHLYAVHHDATLLPAEVNCPDYEFEGDKAPATSVSASRDQGGKIHVSLCNIDPHAAIEVTAQLQGFMPKRISGKVLTAAEITAHNTFETPGVVQPAPFNDAKTTNNGFTATLPAKSIVVLEIEG